MDWLPLVLAGVLAFGILMYIVLDGFDLGVGILFPFMPDEKTRDTAIASIAPVWDGNETWLVLGAALLYGAFPDAYSVVLPAFYIPVMVLLFALILRGVTFEFRGKAHRSKHIWSILFAFGSSLAAFSQGVMLAGLFEGVKVVNGNFAGGPWDWLSWFSIVSGFGVMGGYALLGCTWLVYKAEGGVQGWAQQAALLAIAVTGAFVVIVSIYTPLQFPGIAERWFSHWHWVYLAPIPVLSAWVSYRLIRGIFLGEEKSPFFNAAALFILGYIGIAISLWPNLVPPSLSIWSAAAPHSSLWFMLIITAISLPMVFVYTVYAYGVFHGKVSEEDSYGH
jgi:cytochrome bd quinol oxidase subunit 2 apoprotein (EC 1.10.3.-)